MAHVILFSPLMSQDRGWGCRPVSGKDWGLSVPCDVAIQRELMARLELALSMEGPYLCIISCIFPLNQLTFVLFGRDKFFDDTIDKYLSLFVSARF